MIGKQSVAPPLEVETTKKHKPYIICDPCGVQLFVRGPSGIDAFSRLIERADKDDLWRSWVPGARLDANLSPNSWRLRGTGAKAQ